MSVFFIIIALLAALLLTAMLSPLTFTFAYYADSRAEIKLKYGLISLLGRKKIRPRPPKQKPGKKLQAQNAQHPPHTGKSARNQPKHEQTPSAPACLFGDIFSYSFLQRIKDLFETASPFVKRIMERLNLRVYATLSAGGENAAETAITYGCFCTAATFAVGFLESKVRFKRKRITVLADFSAEKSVVKIKASVSAPAWELIFIGLQAYRKIAPEFKNNAR